MQFKDKQALIIGGSGGIGREISKLLCMTGASVTVHGRCFSPKFSGFIKELQSLASTIGIQPVPRVNGLVQNITSEEFPRIKDSLLGKAVTDSDIVVISFGPFLQKPLCTTDLSDWITMALLDYALPGFFVSSVLPHMMESGWGRILLFGGTHTEQINGFLTNAAYAGAKTGVCSLVRSVAGAYARYGVTCNAVVPGPTDTEYSGPELKKELAAKMPSKKLTKPEAVAAAGMFLLEHEECNGVLLNMDYGWMPGRV